MSSPTRLLLIEDSEDDAELIVLELRKAKINMVWERVETAEGLRAALHREPWDLVLSDYNLPSFGAEAALKIVRSVDPDLPFVVVSGTVGEEFAVKMMRAEASDYVLKHNLVRLVPAIQRELRAAATRKARRQVEVDARRLAAIVQSTDDAIIGFEPDGSISSWNPGAERLLGWSADEAVGSSIWPKISPRLESDFNSLIELFRSGKFVDHSETVWTRKDGNAVHLSLTVSPIRDEQGLVVGICKIARDITKRKQADDALARSEERFRRVIESDMLGIAFWTKRGNFFEMNESLLRLIGYSRAEVEAGQVRWTELTPPEYRHLDENAIVEIERTGRCTPYQKEFFRKDGTRVPVLLGAAWLRAQDEGVAFFLDITSQIQAQEALQLRDRAIRAASQGILITDASLPDHPIVYVSPGFERITGYSAEESLGRNCRFLQGVETNLETVDLLRKTILTGTSCTVELLNYRKDGTTFWNELSISPVSDAAGRLVHFIGVQTDVTARRRLEEQFLQSQKMEAVGQLAGGIAHDFNNLLTIMSGYSEILLERVSPDDSSYSLLQNIHKTGERAAKLTAQLLTFSRQELLAPQVLNLNEVVADTHQMLERVIGEDVQLSVVLSPDLAPVKADPNQLEQVLLNLAVNARDAMMPSGGQLAIETRNVELDATYSRIQAGLHPGSYALLSVSDSGCGMSAEVLAKIFEPFFTTKESGRGTGLGLSTVYGIVRQSNGHIDVESRVGLGTTFRVYFPAIQGETVVTKTPILSGHSPEGTETVLLVEDETDLRSMIHEVLGGLGYTVLEASSGDEALRIASDYVRHIDLLVTDVVMPGLGGREVSERVKVLRPGIRVLFVSGYTDDAVVRHGVLQDEVNFLQKPFSSKTLAFRIREILDLTSR